MGSKRDAIEEPVFLPERLIESCEDDWELAREVLEDFRETTPLRLARLTVAIAVGEMARVRLEAHSLKGSARTIGAEALAEVAELLEKAGAEEDLSNASGLLADTAHKLTALNDSLSAFLSFHHA